MVFLFIRFDFSSQIQASRRSFEASACKRGRLSFTFPVTEEFTRKSVELGMTTELRELLAAFVMSYAWEIQKGEQPGAARMARKATDWRWSSARGHCAGKDAGGVLFLDVWRHLFGNSAVAAAAWTTFLEGPAEEVRRNAGRRPVPYNRVVWSVPVVP